MTGIAFRPIPAATPQQTITFAMPFPAGVFWDGQGLNVGGQAAQVDPFRHHPDGSIRHAGLAVQVPAMAAGEWVPGPIDQGLPRADAMATVPLACAATVAFTIAAMPGVPAVPLPVIDLGAECAAAVAAHTVEYLRLGPLVTEGRFRVPVTALAPDFELVVAVATFADGTLTRMDIKFARELVTVDFPVQANSSQIAPNVVYSVVVTEG